LAYTKYRIILRVAYWKAIAAIIGFCIYKPSSTIGGYFFIISSDIKLLGHCYELNAICMKPIE
jgi:hypothetical protein